MDGLITNWKNITIVVLLAIIAACAYEIDKGQQASVTDSSVSNTQVVSNKVIIEKKPDGTSIETTENTVIDETKKEDTVVVTPASPDAIKSRYQVTILVNPVNPKDIQADVGARIGNLPAFIVVGGDTNRTIHAGVRLEF